MRKLFILIFATLSWLCSGAQVFLQPQLPSSGLILKSQLWNFITTNTGGAELKAQVEVLVSDGLTNRRYFSGTTAPIVIPTGTRHFRNTELLPIAYNVFDAGSNTTADQNGFLPVGHYTICYTIIINGPTVERISENCEAVDVEALNPPVLLAPEDSAKVDELRPVFSWHSPGPAQLFPGLSYDLKVVAPSSLQTGIDAIQNNIPVLEQRGLMSTQFQYPLSIAALDSGKIYAWQVSARTGDKVVARSEVWSFTTNKSGVVHGPSAPVFFARVQPSMPSASTLCTGILRIVYRNERNSKSIQIKISELSGTKPGRSIHSREVLVKPGDNYLEFPVQDILADGRSYLLDLRDERSISWYLKIEYRVK